MLPSLVDFKNYFLSSNFTILLARTRQHCPWIQNHIDFWVNLCFENSSSCELRKKKNRLFIYRTHFTHRYFHCYVRGAIMIKPDDVYNTIIEWMFVEKSSSSLHNYWQFERWCEAEKYFYNLNFHSFLTPLFTERCLWHFQTSWESSGLDQI